MWVGQADTGRLEADRAEPNHEELVAKGAIGQATKSDFMVGVASLLQEARVARSDVSTGVSSCGTDVAVITEVSDVDENEQQALREEIQRDFAEIDQARLVTTDGVARNNAPKPASAGETRALSNYELIHGCKITIEELREQGVETVAKYCMHGIDTSASAAWGKKFGVGSQSMS